MTAPRARFCATATAPSGSRSSAAPRSRISTPRRERDRVYGRGPPAHGAREAARRKVLAARDGEGFLALFDPSVPDFVYYQTPGIFYNSYPWQDPDGTLFSLDFHYNAIVRWAPDVSTATIWRIPSTSFSPSKIVRLEDGKLWISFYHSAQLGRFDDATGTLDIFTLNQGVFPYDIQNYRGLVAYSDQAGYAGFLDPAKSTPTSSTLTATTVVPLVRSTFPTTAVTSALTFDEQDLTPPSVLAAVGSGQPGLAQILVNSGTALWAMLIDEVRGRIFFGTSGALAALSPPPKLDDRELYLTSASAAPFSSDPARSYRTQVVTWNRGTPDSTGATKLLTYVQRILPDGWIAGFSGARESAVPASATLPPQEDVVGTGMDRPASSRRARSSRTSSTTRSRGRVSPCPHPRAGRVATPRTP